MVLYLPDNLILLTHLSPEALSYRVRWHRVRFNGGIPNSCDFGLLLQVIHPFMQILLVVTRY